MEIIAAEPRLVSHAGGFVRLFMVSAEASETCFVRYRCFCINGRKPLLEGVIDAHLRYQYPHHAYVDCELPVMGALVDAAPTICIEVSTDGHFSTGPVNNQIAIGELLPRDFALVAPQALQVGNDSSVVTAIYDSPWLRSVMPLLTLSSSITMRLSFSNSGCVDTFEYGACICATTFNSSINLSQENSKIAAYLEAHLPYVPECSGTAHLEVSLNGLHFVSCETELSILPSFSIIHTLPPVVNSMDTAGLVVLCSTSAPLIPVKGRFPKVLPKCWYLELSSSCGSESENPRNVVHAQLPVVLSQPRRDEISMLDDLVKLRKQKCGFDVHAHRPKPFNSITVIVKSTKLTLLRSGTTIRRFSLCCTELEVNVSCHGTTRTACLGNLWDCCSKIPSLCQVSLESPCSSVLSQQASMMALAEVLTRGEVNKDQIASGRNVSLCMPIAMNILADIEKSVLEVRVALRRRMLQPYANKKMVSTVETIACGRIPVSSTELNESCAESRGLSRPLTVHLETCHPMCMRCEAELLCSVSELSIQSPVEAKSTSVYAFRSCGVQVAKHNIDGRILINLRAQSNCTSDLDYKSPPSEILAVKRCDLISSFWQVHAFDKEEWMVQEVMPDSTLIEREIDVEVRGSGFKHALESSLRVCIELEDGKIVETNGVLADDKAIVFKTPFISVPQMAKLRVAFDFGNTTLWSNPISFEFHPYPKLRDHWPLLLPNSTGGMLSLNGNFFCKTDALRVFFYSPSDTSDIKSARSVILAAGNYSNLTRHAMKPGIAPAFSAAIQVRAAGGTSAAAAAAAGAASVTAASGTDFENIDAMVSDAVRATGGTKIVAIVASHAAIRTANTRNVRSSILESHHSEARGAASQLLGRDFMFHVEAVNDAHHRNDSKHVQPDASELDRFSEFGHLPHLLANLDDCDNDCRSIEVTTSFVDSNKITCTMPPNLPVREVHISFSKSLGHCKDNKVYLFTVGGLWPVCGEATGGTLLRVSGLNFENALRFSQRSGLSAPTRPSVTSNQADFSTVQTTTSHAPYVGSRLARTQSFLPRALKSPPSFTPRIANIVASQVSTDYTLPSAGPSVQSKIKGMRRTMSVRLGNESKVAPNADVQTNGQASIQVAVFFRLSSPTTGRILHRTVVNGALLRLSAAQVANTCSAGASAFSALAGAGDSLYLETAGLGESTPTVPDSGDCSVSALHPSTAVGMAAAENAIKALGPDCVVQCRTPPCPLALLMNSPSFIATVEVSFSGPDGPFSCDNAQYEYVRPLTLKTVLPPGDQLVPGHSILLLRGHSIVSSKALTLHMSLLSAPEGGTSHFGHVRTLERLALSYKMVQRRPNATCEVSGTNAVTGGDEADAEKALMQICATMPFFIRRRYFNRHARRISMFSRAGSASISLIPANVNSNTTCVVARSLKSGRQLNLWLHSQPIVEEAKRRLDAENASNNISDVDFSTERTMRFRRTSVRRQMSSSPQRHLLRQLSRTESLKRSGNPLVRQLSDLVEPSRRLGRNQSQRMAGIINLQHNTNRVPVEKFKRSGSQFRLGDRQLSRSGLNKQAVETMVRRSSRLRHRTSGTIDNSTPIKGPSSFVEPDCLVNEINIELSPNGQDWTERASRKVQLVMPHSCSHVEPSHGPTHGGTAVIIYGDRFPTVCENCVVGFLCLGSCLLPTSTQAAELRGRNIAGANFIDVNIASLESHAAARKIQAVSRGRLLRVLARNGIPCVCVTGVVASPKTISCVTPAVLTNGCTDLVVSFDGINFEWAPTEKLRQIRIAHLLLELGIGADDAAAAAAAISNGILNEENEDVEQHSSKQAATNNQQSSSLMQSQPTELPTPSVPTRDNVALLISPESSVFETKLHLAFTFYISPWLHKVNFSHGPFTDALELIGGRFLPGRQAVIRFELITSDTQAHSNGRITPAQSSTEVEKFDVTGGVKDCTTIQCVAPSILPSGHHVKISISMNGGHDFSGGISYVVKKSPVLSSLRPSCGPRSGGTTIYIHGHNFTSEALDVKVRFSLATGNSPTSDGIGRKLCTVSAISESPGTIKCRLPPFEQLLSNINHDSHLVTEVSEEDPPCDGLSMPDSVNVNNSIVSLWVDVCILGGNVFTGKPLLFLLYDHLPKLGQMRPHSGALSGGYKVKLIGSGFLKTNSITARIIPLPTYMDYSTPQPTRMGQLAKLLASKRQRRRGAVLDQRSISRKAISCDTEISGLDPMWPLTSVGNRRIQVRPIAVRCRCDLFVRDPESWSTYRYHSDTEVSFTMPWLLGRPPGPFLVQVSLNSSEFSEPHERCIFHLFRDHRRRERECFPRLTGPQDVNTSRIASRRLHQLNAARHRPLAHDDASARNNDLAQFEYLSADAQPYEAQPSIRSILRAAVCEVDEKGLIDMSEVVSLARLQEAPVELLNINLPSFDTHPILAKTSDRITHLNAVRIDRGKLFRASTISKKTYKSQSSQHIRLTLIQKLNCILNDREAQRVLLEVLHRAFFLLTRQSSRDGITYGELCEQLMLVHSRVCPVSR